MTYEYPKIEGFIWNFLQKVAIEFNIVQSEISLSGTGDKMFLGLPRELTPEEKLTLDDMVINNPCLPPTTTGSIYSIVDIWGSRQWFETQIGVTPTFWFEQDTPDGSGICHMYVYLPRQLTIQEKKIILDVYKGMITEVL